jgi:hypothetical protein
MSNLYLHIGTHKTGSTAIQSSLKDHSSELEGEGILHVSYFSFLKELMQTECFDPTLAKRVREKLNHNLNYSLQHSADRFILSFEGFSGRPLTGYANAEIIAEILHHAFDDIDVKVIIYLRRQDSFVESMYTQKIQEGESYSFDTFLEQTDVLKIDWYALVNAYGSKFGTENVFVRRYHRKFLPEAYSLIQDFGRVIDSKTLAEHTTSRFSNVGYSRAALETARRTNPHLDNEEQWILRRLLQETNAKEPLQSYSFFAPNERRAFLERHTSSNRRIVDEYCSDEVNRLFPKSDFNESQEWEGLTVEQMTVTLARAIVMARSIANNAD